MTTDLWGWLRFDLPVRKPEELSYDVLVAVVAVQAEQRAARDLHIAVVAGKLGELMEASAGLP